MKKTTIQAFMLIGCLLSTPALSQQFGNLVNMGQIESDEIREASGIAASSNGMEEMIRGLWYTAESIYIV